MLTWIIPIVTIILCGIDALLLIHYQDRIEDVSITLMDKKGKLYCVIALLVTSGIAVLFSVYGTRITDWVALKWMSLLCIMWPLALTDFKVYKIPNMFIIYGLVIRLLLVLAELVWNPSFSWYSLLSGGIAAIALLAAAILCSVIMKNSIGYGDMKLFVIMGLFLGLENIWDAIFMSLVFSFILAIILLLTKKKSRKDYIPFAPALVLGTYIALTFSGI